MFRPLFTFLLVTGLTHFSFAQPRHDYVWLLGYHEYIFDVIDSLDVWGGSAIDFNTGDTAEVYRQFIGLDFFNANAVICDSAGQLQLYSNGHTLVNGLHQTVIDGINLSPFSQGYDANQGALLLPHPGQEGRYVLFSARDFLFIDIGPMVTFVTALSPLYYHFIDINAVGGRGRVIAKNQVASTDTLIQHGALTAVKHANGRDWWVFSAVYAKPKLKRLLLTPQGVEDWGYAYIDSTLARRGINQSVFSPDGQFFAYASSNSSYGGNLTLMHFDRCTGEFSQFRRLNHYNIPTATNIGAAFSENSRFLYLAFPEIIYQYDLWAGDNWPATEDTVAVYDGFYDPIPGFEVLYDTRTYFGTAQLAPNGEIWLVAGGARYLSVIRHPNLPGDSCQVDQHAVMLPTINGFSMPNLPYPRLGALEGSACDTLFTHTPPPPTEGANAWLFPNPARHTVYLSAPSDGSSLSFAELLLYNSQGQLQRRFMVRESGQALDISGLPAGVYVYRLLAEDQPARQGKLVISK